MSARRQSPIEEPTAVRWALIALCLAFLLLFLIVPMAVVLHGAFRSGVSVFVASVTDPEALSAIRLTLLTAAIVVPLNALFGVAAAWAISRFRFQGKDVLITLIDLPFAVSPVIAGMVFVLLFGRQGVLGDVVQRLGVPIIFAVPGIVLATLFVTLPFVARELIVFMQAQGHDDEEAALTLGASPWQTFRRVTLPAIKWALLYGVLLANARSLGEFGAVSVVSGHIRGQTNTMPLHVEILYNEYNFAAAFAVSSLLLLAAVLTLLSKRYLEWRHLRRTREHGVRA